MKTTFEKLTPTARSKKAKPVKVTYDLAVVGRLDRVTAPKQARSEESVLRVMGALETLLKSKPFSEISVPEIAAMAGRSAASLYGRFQDKGSMLAALHESLHERAINAIAIELDPQRWEGKSLEDLIKVFCTSKAEFYKDSKHLLTAALISRDREIYERTALTIQHVSECFIKALRVMPGANVTLADELRIDLCIRGVFALLQQRVLFEPVEIGGYSRNADRAFMDELSVLMRVGIGASA